MKPRPAVPALCRWLLAAGSWLVPADVRADWRREWMSEVGARVSEARRQIPERPAAASLALRCLGAIVHAAWLRWDRWRPEMWTYDLRIAARTLLRQPAFLALAVLILGVGIGATAATFGAVRAVMLRPLPFPAPERLVAISTTSAIGPGVGASSSPPDVMDWHGQQHAFDALAAFSADAFALSGRQTAEQVPGASVTGEFFDVLGVGAARGRTIASPDARVGAAPVVVLSDALWRRRFAGAPDIVGTSVDVDGVARDVVGVMPPGLAYPLDAEVWVPLAFTEEELSTQRGAQYLDVVGRLSAGSSLEVAQADLAAIARRLAEAHPRTNEGRGVLVRPLRASLVGDARPGLLLLLAAAVVVLLVVCANIAGLLATRAMAGARDLAIRAALGAARARLVRESLVESAMLAGTGGAVGLAIAWAGTKWMAARQDAVGIPLIDQTRVDPAVVAVAVVAAAGSALVCGVVPALKASGLGDLARRVRAGGTAMSARVRGRSVLVVAEIALAVVLVVSALTLARAFARLTAVDVGIDTSDRVQTFTLTLPDAQYAAPAARAAFADRLLAAVRGLPGVERAGAVFGLPLSGFGYRISLYELDGARVPDTPDDMVLLNVRAATPDYFQAIGLPLRRGRGFQPGDGQSSPKVVVVNEAAALALWPGEDALGRHLTVGTRLIGSGSDRAGGEVVGVVADSRERGPASPPRPTLYVAYAQFPTSFVSVALRTGPGGPDVSTLRTVLAGIDPDVPMFRVRTTAQLASAIVAQPRLLMLLMSVFAAAALAVAAIGLYGILAQVVEARRKEFGIRRAVGASVGQLVSLVARDTTRVVATGVLAGVAVSAAVSKTLQPLVFDGPGLDAGSYLGTIVAFLFVAALAALVPCRRALSVDPVVTLKAE